MRTFLIIFLTLVLLGGGFAAYVSMQKPTGEAAGEIAGRRRRAPQRTALDDAERARDRQRRQPVGQAVRERRARRRNSAASGSEPKGGDVVLVTRPQAEFFTGDGTQRLRIEGASGEVIVPGGGGR